MQCSQVILGVVICSVHSEDSVPFTFIIVDKGGTPLVVTLYNLSPGKGVIIGDTVAIPEPHFTHINLTWEEVAKMSSRPCSTAYSGFPSVCLTRNSCV